MDEGRGLISRIDIDDKGTVWATITGGVAWFDGESWSQYYWDSEARLLRIERCPW